MDEESTTINLSRQYIYFAKCEVFKIRQGVLLTYLYFVTIELRFYANIIQSMELFYVAGFDEEASRNYSLICIALEPATLPGSPHTSYICLLMNKDLAMYVGLGENTCDFQLDWSSDKLPAGLGCEGLGNFHPEHVRVRSSLSVNKQRPAPRFNNSQI